MDTFGATLLAPATWLGGAALAMNLYVVGNLVFAAWAAGRLARAVVRGPDGGAGSDAAATFAALAFAATPQLLAQVHNGITETVAVGWLPLYALALVRLGEAPTLRRGALAGLAGAACAWANAYWGVFAAGIGVVWVAALALRTPRRARRAVPALFAGLAAGAVAVAPAALAFRASLDAGDAVVARDPGFVWASLVGHNMSDLLDFFRPGDRQSAALVALDDDLRVVVYLGWASLVAAALGLRRDPARARPWAAGALAAFVLALGPFLYAGGQYVRLGEAWVPLPFLALFDLVPGLSRVSHAFRFVLLAGLFLSVLGAVGVAAARRPWRWGLGLGAAVLAEALFASPAPFPAPVSNTDIPAAYADLVAAPGEPVAAVLDLPVTAQVLARSRATWFQALHGRAVPWGLNDPLPPALVANPLAGFLVRLERSPVDTLDPAIPALDLEVGRRALADAGYRWILVHREMYPPARVGPTVEVLRLVCGEPEEIGGIVRFRVDGGATARGP